MTILEAQNALYNHFLKSDYFSIEKDISNIRLVDMAENLLIVKAVTKAALDRWTELGMIKELEIKGESGRYVLVKPISHYLNPVEISPAVAAQIAEIVNRYVQKTETLVDPLNIKGRDIEDLLIITINLISKQQQELE